jgi:AP-2 complex subunit alpha
VTLFVAQRHDFTKLVIAAIKKDLSSSSDLNVCLALHAIANISSREMLESLGDVILGLLLS